MNAGQSSIDSEKGLEPAKLRMTNPQKTHCENIPDVSDDSQDKDVEKEKKSITATTSEKTWENDFKNKAFALTSESSY